MERTSKAKILEGNVSADPELVRIYSLPQGLLNYHYSDFYSKWDGESQLKKAPQEFAATLI